MRPLIVAAGYTAFAITVVLGARWLRKRREYRQLAVREAQRNLDYLHAKAEIQARRARACAYLAQLDRELAGDGLDWLAGLLPDSNEGET